MSTFDVDAYVSAAAPALGLTLTDVQHKGAVQFLRIAAQMAKIVQSAPVAPDTFDLAPTFRPGTPGPAR